MLNLILSIQILRAIAALLVVLHHISWKCSQFSSSNPWDWMTFGGAGVDLFFIVSGYIMCQVSYSRENNFIVFISARIKRIIPLYWGLSFFALVVYLLSPHLVNSSGGDTDVYSSFFLLPTKGKYLIQNGWTLRFEFLFYFIFALFLVFFKGVLHLIFTSLFICALVFIGIVFSVDGIVFEFLTSPMLFEFVFGMSVFFIFYKNFNVRFEFGILLVVLGGALFYLSDNNWNLHRVWSWGVPALIFFVGIRSLEAKFNSGWRSWAVWLGKLGDSSYSLYLVHPFSLAGSAIFLKKIGFSYNPFIFSFVLFFSALISGYLCYLLLEQPLLKAFRRFSLFPGFSK
ncbi:acyltransferase family protein [Quatrionicoccus australiensis]|uniref:acyltransferase family protein n=1 Tax=Quatrionicoccus australiensis TaxID=138118 RepID=UPI001CFB2552|nr:acyltransferase [Quatrionicoccus australiensis]MCB4358663.1 acyltransferase [Quatrionicoccus australiensis]